MLSGIAVAQDDNERSEFLGSASLALLVGAVIILPYNLVIRAMNKWGLDILGWDNRRFNEQVKKIKPIMVALHVLFGFAVLLAATYHAVQVWDVATYVLLHYAAIAGITAMLVTGILALYVPLPPRAKRLMWKLHCGYVFFGIIIALLAVAHVLVLN